MLRHLKCYQRSITLIKTGRLNKNKTNINTGTSEKRKETGGETNISMCSSSASTNTSTYTINSTIKFYMYVCRPMYVCNVEQQLHHEPIHAPARNMPRNITGCVGVRPVSAVDTDTARRR